MASLDAPQRLVYNPPVLLRARPLTAFDCVIGVREAVYAAEEMSG